MAYFTAPAYYNVIREMPAGCKTSGGRLFCTDRSGTETGYADLVFIPRANAGCKPAMVIELKYNKDADTAINQIKDKKYQGALSGYSDRILLVGINYDKESDNKKHHTCIIEEWKI